MTKPSIVMGKEERKRLSERGAEGWVVPRKTNLGIENDGKIAGAMLITEESLRNARSAQTPLNLASSRNVNFGQYLGKSQTERLPAKRSPLRTIVRVA